jgi:hypothetical protein
MKLPIGARFGLVETLGPSITRPGSKLGYTLCRCDCGRVWEVKTNSLKVGDTKSCGCAPNPGRTTHGMARTPEYKVWGGLISRCHNPQRDTYRWYGARGITVCEEWRHSFEAFYRDMGPRPWPGATVERKDNLLGYNPQNCVWATRFEQMQNTRGTKLVSLNGERVSMAEAARRMGVGLAVVYKEASGDKRRGKPKASAQEAVDRILVRQKGQQ